MSLIHVYKRFPDHESCIEHLEDLRWHDNPCCPKCGSVKVGRKVDGDRIGRWNCHDCHRSFNVLSGTIFQKTKIDLQKWFLATALILNAKKSVSSHQLARDLELTQPTAWRMAMQVRRAMASDDGLLQGIVEADEAYVGGKPRKSNKRDDDEPRPRGRGTKKLPIIGAVERGGRVVAEPALKVSAEALRSFLLRNVDPASLLITDEYRGYNAMRGDMRHATINHAERYADGETHTNTIEGFWALVKRAWYGTHHHYSRKHAWAYIAEACYKYNLRGTQDAFGAFMRGTVAA